MLRYPAIGSGRSRFATSFLALLLVGACLFFSSRVRITEDAGILLPESPASLRLHYHLLADAPFAQYLTLSVANPHIPPATLAQMLEEKLRSPLIPDVMGGGGGSISPAALSLLCDFVPAFMRDEDFEKLPSRIGENAIDNALHSTADILLSPRGLALRELLAKDPLGISASVFAGLRDLYEDAPLQFANGYMLDKSGQYAMLLARPAFPLSFSTEAEAVMAHVEESVKDLPAETEVIIAGGHRHSAANAAMIKDDLQRVLPLSLGLLALIFAVFLREKQAVLIFLVPFFSLIIATGFAGFVLQGISGIIIGFGSVLLGISADYAIHVYFHIRGNRAGVTSIMGIARPLLLACLTTVTAFLAFFLSSIPAVRHIGFFAISGLLGAVFFSLFVLPPYLCRKQALLGDSLAEVALPEGSKPFALKWKKIFPLLLLIAGLLPFLFQHVSMDGNIQSLSYVSEEIRRDEEATRQIWGNMRESAFIAARVDAVEGQSLAGRTQELLERNWKIWEILQNDIQQNDARQKALARPQVDTQRHITSLAPFLPPLRVQKERHARWATFWNTHGPEAIHTIEGIAPGYGFAPQAFAPFAAWIYGEPTSVLPDSLEKTGQGRQRDFLLYQNEKASTVYTLLDQSEELSLPLVESLGTVGGEYVSGQTFRNDVGEATKRELTLLCSTTLCAIVLISLLMFRTHGRFVLVLLPVVGSVFFVLAVFCLLQVSMNIFHAVALPLVMALSVDYGIFMVSFLEGKLDKSTRKAVLLSALTTISGFGSLVFARHPALFSLGLTVAAGILAALFIALVLLPLLVTDKKNFGQKQHKVGL